MNTPLDLPALKAKLFQARLSLVEAEPFLGSLTLSLPVFVEPRPGLTTACVTSQGECYFDPGFLARLALPEVRAVLLHETLHLALDAFHRQAERHPLLWNMAHDHAVNLLIDQAGLAPDFLRWPRDFTPLLDSAYRGMNAEQIYSLLLSTLEEAPPGWKGDVIEVPNSGDGQPGPSPEALRERWKEAMVAAAERAIHGKGLGSLPDWAQKLLGPILNPQVPWPERLAQKIHGRLTGCARTFVRPGRRSTAVGATLPGARRNRGVVGVFVDVSGSISPGELGAFMGELRGILDQVQVHVRLLTWDAEVQEDLLLDPGEDLKAMVANRSIQFRGGGGTDPRCVIRALQEAGPDLPQPAFGVLFTDGALDWPDPSLWPLDLLVVTTSRKPPQGYDTVTLKPTA